MDPSSNQNNEPLYYQDATALAALIRHKDVTPREVVQAHLDRISAVNPQLNAIVTLLAEEALRGADAAGKAVMSGAPLGPLHGVPFTIKDSIDTAGILTQRGSKLFAGNTPEKDATVVTRFKAAGGIPLAKTNVPEFSGWWETDNVLTGRTNNPWNLDRTPGGSSGGESAAIAAGLSPIGLGSDVAISLRGPAAFTGIAALKATQGRIPYTGHYPTALPRYFHIGPMARTVRDIALGYSLLQGPDGVDGYAIHSRNAASSTPRFAGQPVRVGWVSEAAFGPVDPEISAAVADAAKLLKDLGCQVEEVSLPFIDNPLGTLFTVVYGELVPTVKALAAGRESELSAIGKGIIAMADPSFTDFVAAETKAKALRSAFAGYFQHYDVLLCPVTPFTATPHGAQEVVVNGVAMPMTHVMSITSTFNLTGLPALSLPFRRSSEHLPINVQLVGRWFDEATILELGQLLDAASGIFGTHPSI